MAEATYQKLKSANRSYNLPNPSLAADGDYCATGTITQLGGAKAWLWGRSGSTWSELAEIVPSPSTGAYGYAIDIYVESISPVVVWIVVGGYGYDTPSVNAGACYLFRWDGATLTETESAFQGTGLVLNSYFGTGVAIHDGWILVGSENGVAVTGKAYLFSYDSSGNVTEEHAGWTGTQSAGGDDCGAAVAMDGTHAIIGSPSGTEAIVYVCTYSGGALVEQTYLTRGPSTKHGISVSIYNDVIAAFASNAGGAGKDGFLVWRGSGSSWTLEDAVHSSGNYYGQGYVSAGYNVIVYGDASGYIAPTTHGLTDIYKYAAGSWSRVYRLYPDDVVSGDLNGRGVAVATWPYVISGCAGDDENYSNSGAVYAWLCDDLPLEHPDFSDDLEPEDQYGQPPYGGVDPEDDLPAAGYGATSDPLGGGEELCGEIEDHLTRALALLPGQFEDSSMLRSLIGSFIGPPGWGSWGVQQIECVLTALRDERWLSTAIGQQLDGLGELVGSARLSGDDAEYLAALLLQIVINTSKGEPETLISIAQQISNAAKVHLTELPPSRVRIFLLGTAELGNLAKLDKSAGAGIAVTVVGSASQNPFRFGVDRDAAGAAHGVALPYGAGFGETTYTGIGGLFPEIYIP